MEHSENLEEYAHGLEKKLLLKSNVLDQAVRLHQGLTTRLDVLENGLSWKDAQIEELTRENEDLCKISASWQQRAERLEEDNCALRDALIEKVDQNEQLQELLNLEMQSRQQSPEKPPIVSSDNADASVMLSLSQQTELLKQNELLKKQVKETIQKTVLLEEQLRMRSGREVVADLGGAYPEMASLRPKDAWDSVGLGAADRIYGSVPHVPDSFIPQTQGSRVDDLGSDGQPNERNRLITFCPADSVAAPQHLSSRVVNESPPTGGVSSGIQDVKLSTPYQDLVDICHDVARKLSGISANDATADESSTKEGPGKDTGRQRLANAIRSDSSPQLSPMPVRVPLRSRDSIGRASQIRPEVLSPILSSHAPSWRQQSPQAPPRSTTVVAPSRSVSSQLLRGIPGQSTPTSATSSSVPSLWGTRAPVQSKD